MATDTIAFNNYTMRLKLTSKAQETSDVTSFYFEPESELAWKAGQFLHYKLDHSTPDDRGIERWFTISNAPFEKQVRITTRFAGEKSSSFKRALFQMSIGSFIEADGPEGEFIIEDFSQKYVFIAGGIGITPFRSIFKQIEHDGNKINVDLLYGNRNEEYVFEKELNEVMENQPEMKIHKFTDPKRIEEKDVREIVSDLNIPLYYVSGPKPMVLSFKEMLMNMGIAEINILLDKFPGYDAI